MSSAYSASITLPPDGVLRYAGAPLLPLEVEGFFHSRSSFPDSAAIAISVNGEFVASCRPFRSEQGDDLSWWSALIPKTALRLGENHIEIALARWGNSDRGLQMLAPAKMDFTQRNLILDQLTGVQIKGLHPITRRRGQSIRWTTGSASLHILNAGLSGKQRLRIKALRSYVRHASLFVVANAIPIAVIDLGAGATEALVELGGVDVKNGLHLQLLSEFARPADADSNSSDLRSFGVALADLRLEKIAQFGESAARPITQFLPLSGTSSASLAGFHKASRWGSRSVVWTDGNASTTVQWTDASSTPSHLIVDIASCGPAGSEMELIVNGISLGSSSLKAGASTRVFRLPNDLDGSTLTVEIQSGSFRPIDFKPDSKDSRTLGLAIFYVALLN